LDLLVLTREVVSAGDEQTGTVGALHERIYELCDSRGWFVFRQLYHEPAGLHPRHKPANTSNAVSATDTLNAQSNVEVRVVLDF